MDKANNVVDEAEFLSTEKYINKIVQSLKLNKDSYLKVGDEPHADKRLIDFCIEILLYIDDKHIGFIKANDELKVWTDFLIKWEPRLSNYTDFVKNCFVIIAIAKILSTEIKIKDESFVLPQDLAEKERQSLSGHNKAFKEDYANCLSEYENFVKFSALELRVDSKIEEGSKTSVRRELMALRKELFENKNDIKFFIKNSSDSVLEIRNDIEENKSLLSEVKSEIGFMALYSGFDKYSKELSSKILRLNIEKYFWMILIGLMILKGIYSNSFSNAEWMSLIPIGGAIILLSTMLKVNLKKLDQYEQILSKVKHKLAVSTFYQTELKDVDENKDSKSINDEYYRFLFSEIETTEWNTPDVASDIANILKSYKK